jgi:hypothetical protein
MQQNSAPAHRKTDSTPRWVKMFAFVFASLIALFALAHLTGADLRHGQPPTHASDLRQ